MDDALLSGQQSVSALADAIASALTQGDSVLVTGAEGTTAVLAAVARVLVRSRTRVLQVRPPYDLPALMHQLAPPTDDARHAVTTAAFRSLTAINPTCERIALLVEDAHLMPEATLGYVEAALNAGPHLRVALAGRDELGVMLGSPGLSGLRGRLSFHRIGSAWEAKPPPAPPLPVAAAPAPRPIPAPQRDDQSRDVLFNQARPSPGTAGLVAPGVTMQAGTARPSNARPSSARSSVDRVPPKSAPDVDPGPRPQPVSGPTGPANSRIPLRTATSRPGTTVSRMPPNPEMDAYHQSRPVLVASVPVAPGPVAPVPVVADFEALRTAVPSESARPVVARPRAALPPVDRTSAVDRIPAGNAPRSSAAGWIWGSVLGTVFLGMIVLKVLLPAHEDPSSPPRAAAQPDVDPGPAFVVPETPAPSPPGRESLLQNPGSASQSVLPEPLLPAGVTAPAMPSPVSAGTLPLSTPALSPLPLPAPAPSAPAALVAPSPGPAAGAVPPPRREDTPKRAVIQPDPPLPPLQPAPPRPPRTRPVVTARTDPRTTRILEEGLNAIPYPVEQEPLAPTPVAPPERAAGDRGSYIGTFSTDENGVRTFHVIR